MPSRRAAPTSASAASEPGQVISREEDLPGSVSEPCARKAPRQAASASQVAPDTTAGGRPRMGRPRPSTSPVCRASSSPSLTTLTTYRLPRRRPPGAITTRSEECPKISNRSLRSRRAATPVSSSASITIRPLTMCKPPANLRIAETSALRQQARVTGSRLISSFTAAVIAMGRSFHVSGKSGRMPRPRAPGRVAACRRPSRPGRAPGRRPSARPPSPARPGRPRRRRRR